MQELSMKSIALIAGLFLASCGNPENFSQSKVSQAGVRSVFSDISQMKINHFGKQYHLMTAKGPRIGGNSCIYTPSQRLNLCAAISPENDDTFAKLSPPAIDTQNQSSNFKSFQNSFEVATYDFGVASLAVLQPLEDSRGDRLFVIGANVPINHSEACFANLVCNEKQILEVNGGIKISSYGVSTELGLTYDTKENRLGMYVKGASEADDVNFRVHFNGAKVLLETVGKDLQVQESALKVEAIEIEIEKLMPMIDMLTEQMKKLSSSCFKWDDEV